MKKNLKLQITAMNKIAWLCLLMWISGIVGYSCMAMENFDDRRPNEHFCPITLEVMRNPVVAADGYSYEKSAISQYVNVSAKSPITGLPLKNRDIIDNHALKVMIEEWKPGRQGEPSALETRSADDIARRVKEEFRKNAVLLNSAKDQHIVAFLGNTGAGKSTLINLLAGKELKVGAYEEDYVLAHPEDKTAMAIGTSGNSETLYPKSIDVGGLRFFDLPGFNDTDGSERNLVNAAFTRQILLYAASVRLVFVAGQDQFTADRSASIKQMFNCIKQLFVVGQNISLIDDGVFVATKMTWNKQGDLVDYLSRRTNTNDRAELSDQLKSWNQRNKLCCMFHPVRDGNNKGIKDQILGFIKDTKPAKVLGINVSVLYPPDTKTPLERMFLKVIEGAFDHKFNTPLTTLSEFDKAINFYMSQDFWQTFDADVCREEDAIGLLKEFCINPYIKAFRNFEKENEGKRQDHIQALRNKKEERIGNIEKRTDTRAKEVILSLVPKSENDDFVLFDFAYHKDIHNQVCGSDSINQLATDVLEQEIVRSYYAGFISQHSHEQMKRWHEKFSGVGVLVNRLAIMEEELRALKAEQIVEEKRPIEIKPSIPLVAKGYEEIYRRFLNGVLIYRPDGKSDNGRINLRISDLLNPLEGTFDLSQCGDTGNYLSISTGYRKQKKAENASKLEIWFTPRFLVEKEITTTAKHISAIFPSSWADSAPVGMLWTWGGWDNLGWYDYLTTENMDNLSKIDLYENWKKVWPRNVQGSRSGAMSRFFSCSFCELK